MGGPYIQALIEIFKHAYAQFIEDNRYAGFTPAMLHAKAMAYARDKLAGTYPITYPEPQE